MTQGLSSGPYGNPNRYDMGVGSGVPIDVIFKGSFERAISIFRADYSYITMSRANLPNDIGAMMWFGHYAPHATVFVPFYVSSELPIEYQMGSLYKLNRQSSYWAFCLIGNWLEKHYKFIILDVQKHQSLFETASSKAQQEIEARALDLYNGHEVGAARAVISEWTIPFAQEVVRQAWQFFEFIIVRYHDGYMFNDLTAEFLSPVKLFYPYWWLKQVDFFDPLGSRVPSYMSDTPADLNITIVPDNKPPATTVAPRHILFGDKTNAVFVGKEQKKLHDVVFTPQVMASTKQVEVIPRSTSFFEMNSFSIIALLGSWVMLFMMGVIYGRYSKARSEYQLLDGRDEIDE